MEVEDFQVRKDCRLKQHLYEKGGLQVKKKLLKKGFQVKECQVRTTFEIENRRLIQRLCLFENPNWDHDQIANANEYNQWELVSFHRYTSVSHVHKEVPLLLGMTLYKEVVVHFYRGRPLIFRLVFVFLK